jgi:hypothetical protein
MGTVEDVFEEIKDLFDDCVTRQDGGASVFDADQLRADFVKSVIEWEKRHRGDC